MQRPPAKPTLDIRRETRQCPTCGQRFSPDATFCPFDGSKLALARYDPLGDPLLGATVEGRYEVLSLLGEGGMGQVYEVRHVALDRRFALKVLRRELARDEDLAARFLDEARATASIRHAHVVQITDFGRLPDGVPYFVMELLVGETLGRVLKAGGPVPAARAVRILRQVAGALGAAHDAGIVHRDLKPENVFLLGGMAGGDGDDVRLVDFGAAKIIGSSRVTRAGIVYGTPHYMSPEQASGEAVDHRTDIYALGVIMYEMFTGRVPFEADTYMGVLTQHMFVKPVPPSQVSPAARELGALEVITLRCLEKKPEDRYATMRELGDALAEFSSDAPVPSSRPPRNVASERPRYRMADELEPPTLAEMRGAIDSLVPPRRPVPWVWLGLFGVVVGAVVVLLVFGGRRPTAVQPVPSAAAVVPTAGPVPPAAPASAAVPPPSAGVPPSAAAAPSSAPSAVPSGARKPLPRPPPPIDDIGDPFAGRH